MSSKATIGILALMGILSAGCVTGPVSQNDSQDSYPVTLETQTLTIEGGAQLQDIDGVQANISVRDSKPELQYRYRISQSVNGTYFMMPNPPKSYTVYRVPFYANNPDGVLVKITLTNNTQDVVNTGNAICAFDVDGQTILSQQVKAPDLLPGHSLVALVNGPPLDKLQGHHSLTIWLYQLSAQSGSKPYKWVVSYQLLQQTRIEQAMLIGRFGHESDVAPYRDRIDKTVPGASPGNGTP